MHFATASIYYTSKHHFHLNWGRKLTYMCHSHALNWNINKVKVLQHIRSQFLCTYRFVVALTCRSRADKLYYLHIRAIIFPNLAPKFLGYTSKSLSLLKCINILLVIRLQDESKLLRCKQFQSYVMRKIRSQMSCNDGKFLNRKCILLFKNCIQRERSWKSVDSFFLSHLLRNENAIE